MTKSEGLEFGRSLINPLWHGPPRRPDSAKRAQLHLGFFSRTIKNVQYYEVYMLTIFLKSLQLEILYLQVASPTQFPKPTRSLHGCSTEPLCHFPPTLRIAIAVQSHCVYTLSMDKCNIRSTSLSN